MVQLSVSWFNFALICTLCLSTKTTPFIYYIYKGFCWTNIQAWFWESIYQYKSCTKIKAKHNADIMSEANAEPQTKNINNERKRVTNGERNCKQL